MLGRVPPAAASQFPGLRSPVPPASDPQRKDPSERSSQSGCFCGKWFLHDWASEQRSRPATTWKRLVQTSRIFFVFMIIPYIYGNRSFFCDKIYPVFCETINPMFCEKTTYYYHYPQSMLVTGDRACWLLGTNNISKAKTRNGSPWCGKCRGTSGEYF